MRAQDVIRKKRDGLSLSAQEIAAFVQAAAHGTWADYQLSAMLMAIFLKGMNAEESATLTRAMADSGKRLNLDDIPGVKVDKHSTGGVGDKTSMILAPLVAACGAIVPMMSGRGLGHTGGTLDKLESIPGFRVNLSEAEFRSCLKSVGIGMIGQTVDVAPADKKLYALRDVTSTVESIPLITASILSKKLAEGISGLVMDVKCGRGAFMKSRSDAAALARSIVRVGTDNGLRVQALITNMNAPLGNAIGNALEIIECIQTLQGHGPKDLEELSILLASKMVFMAQIAPDEAAAEIAVRKVLANGTALQKFREMVQAQGGDPAIVDHAKLLPHAPDRHEILAQSTGFIQELDAEELGIAGMLLGAGRQRAEDCVDHAVGLILKKKLGDAVQQGEPIIEIHHRAEKGLAEATSRIRHAIFIGDNPLSAEPLVWETIS